MIDLEKNDPRYAWRSREFNLHCKVIRKSVSYFDHEEQKTHTANLILLQPIMNTEAGMFLTAWLPEEHMDTEENPSKIELPVWLEGPVNMATKVNVKRAGHYEQSSPFMIVMPIFMETLINNNKDIKELRIKVFPEEKMEEFETLMKSYKVLPDVSKEEFFRS